MQGYWLTRPTQGFTQGCNLQTCARTPHVANNAECCARMPLYGTVTCAPPIVIPAKRQQQGSWRVKASCLGFVWRMFLERDSASECEPSPVSPQIIMPIHCGMHWTCAVVDIKNESIYYYDSLMVRVRERACCVMTVHGVLCHTSQAVNCFAKGLGTPASPSLGCRARQVHGTPQECKEQCSAAPSQSQSHALTAGPMSLTAAAFSCKTLWPCRSKPDARRCAPTGSVTGTR